MGWLSEYTDAVDQSNAEALTVTNRPSAYEVAYDHNYWIYAAIAGALILLVWILKKPVLEWFRANQFAILNGLNVFFWLCIFPAILLWLFSKPKSDTWKEWAYSAWNEVAIGLLGIVALTAVFYVVSFVHSRTKSYVAGWIAFFVMLVIIYQVLNLFYS